MKAAERREELADYLMKVGYAPIVLKNSRLRWV